MTTQPDPAPTGQKPARQLVEPLREIAALVLLGANAVLLFVAFLTLVVPSGFSSDSFTFRSAGAFDNFINLGTIGLPLIAVALAVLVTPALPKAKLIVTVALVEFGVSAFFGVLFGLLVGVVVLADSSIPVAFFALLERLAWSAVLGLVAYGVWTIFQGNYYTPKPKAAPGMYGQPGQPYPGQPYPGQQPYQQHPGQQPPQYGYPPQQQYGAPYGDPQQYGQQTTALPVQPPPPGSPVAPQQQPYQQAPQSGPPYQQAPNYPAPQSGPPQSGPPSSSVPPHVQPPAPQGPPPGYPPQGPPPGYDQTPRNTDDR